MQSVRFICLFVAFLLPTINYFEANLNGKKPRAYDFGVLACTYHEANATIFYFMIGFNQPMIRIMQTGFLKEKKIFGKFNQQSRVMITIMIMIMCWLDQNTRVHTQIDFKSCVCVRM